MVYLLSIIFYLFLLVGVGFYKIKSVKNIASDLHILLDCQDIQPDIYLILSFEKELKIGQVLKVMA